VADSAEALERRIDDLRAAVRRAVTVGDREAARSLRSELREVERLWDDAIAALDTVPASGPLTALETPTRETPARRAVPRQPGPRQPGPSQPGPRQPSPLLPLRDQVHQALILLGAPAAPRLVIAVHQAFHPGTIVAARLTSLRRDEERSFRAAPFSRPYYLCSALTSDLLAPARGLLAVSTWPMATRIVGPLSARVDFLTAAIHLAGHIERSAARTPEATRLLWQFAANIPGAATAADAMSAPTVAAAARAELTIHEDADRSHREAAARRARKRLDDVDQLFGSRLRTITATG
jgi:hypothetical protein